MLRKNCWGRSVVRYAGGSSPSGTVSARRASRTAVLAVVSLGVAPTAPRALRRPGVGRSPVPAGAAAAGIAAGIAVGRPLSRLADTVPPGLVGAPLAGFVGGSPAPLVPALLSGSAPAPLARAPAALARRLLGRLELLPSRLLLAAVPRPLAVPLVARFGRRAVLGATPLLVLVAALPVPLGPAVAGLGAGLAAPVAGGRAGRSAVAAPAAAVAPAGA